MARRVEDLLAQREGRRVDFKLDASSTKNIVKDFVAFSNSAGGSILIGVDDDRNIVGLKNPQGAEETISNAIYSSTDPPQAPVVSVLTQGDEEVVLVEAQYFQGAEPLRLKDGSKRTVYQRVGSSSVKIDDEGMLEQIRRERRGRDGFDQLAAIGSSVDDLDLEAIVDAFGARGIDVDEPKLESYELAKRENGELIPTHAGILLFGKDPGSVLPDAYLRAIRYPGEDKTGDALDSGEWKAMSLLRGVDEVERFIARNTGTAQTIPGSTRRDIPHYEPSLLREVLHNAIAHADYSRQGQHLNVSIFSDHMLVDSPGKLPSGMSFEALEGGVSLARNRAIMNILHLIGYVEKHGTVYAKAVAAAAEGYPLPEWSEPGPLVRVTLKPHPRSERSVAAARPKRRDRRPDVLAAFGDDWRSPRELLEALGGEIGERQLRRVIKELHEAGLIEADDAPAQSPRRRYRLVVSN